MNTKVVQSFQVLTRSDTPQKWEYIEYEILSFLKYMCYIIKEIKYHCWSHNYFQVVIEFVKQGITE